MRNIGELLASHAAETAWVFGKGQSLDEFDMSTAGPLRICINESQLRVPRASYFFAHDELPIQRVAAQWPETCRAILQPVRATFAIECGIPDNAIFYYEKRERELGSLDWPPETIAQNSALLGLTGTVHSALHFCRLIGAGSIVFVGMDGGGPYAASLGMEIPTAGGRHDVIRQHSIDVLRRLGMKYRFVETQDLGQKTDATH